MSGAAATGRTGSWSLILLKDGATVETVPFSGDGITHAFDSSGAGRYAIEVVRSDLDVDYIEDYSSPIWLQAGPPTFKLGKLKLNKGKGTAKLQVRVGGSGNLALTGKDVAKQKASPDGAGNYKLEVKPKGKLKRKLAKKGKAKVKLAVEFARDGGRPATLKQKAKLKQKRGGKHG